MSEYVIILVRPQGPINIGMICRLAANLNAQSVRLVQPACETDTAEARMFAHHALPVLEQAEVFSSLTQAVADCDWVVGTTARRRRDNVPELAPEGIASEAVKRSAQRVALVFGSEVNGLTEDELRVCQASVRLQTPGPYPSYNLSQAVAITLYLATCGSGVALQAPQEISRRAAKVAPTINQTEETRLLEYWLDTLDATGYFRRMRAERFAPKLQRLVGRLRLSAPDMHTIWGMLAHFRNNEATSETGRRESI